MVVSSPPLGRWQGSRSCELAEAAGVTARTIHRLEIGGVVHVAPKKRHGHVSREIMDKVIDALARHGVELVPEGDGRGAGARWRLPRASRPGEHGDETA